MAGKPAKCPGCGRKFRVPGPVTAQVTSTGAKTPCKENFLATCKYFSRHTDDADITTSRCSLKTLRYLDDNYGQHTGGDQNFCLGCAVYEIKSEPPVSPAPAQSSASQVFIIVFTGACIFAVGAIMITACVKGLWIDLNIYDPYDERSLFWKWFGVLFFSFWFLFGLLMLLASMAPFIEVAKGKVQVPDGDAPGVVFVGILGVVSVGIFTALCAGIIWLVGATDTLRPYKNLIESEKRFVAISGLKSIDEESQVRPVIKGKVYVIDKDDARLDFAMQMRLPEHLRATTPEEVQTVVWLDYELRRVGNYGTTSSYGNGPRIPGYNSETIELTAWANDCKVTVIDLQSKSVLIDSQLILGQDPPPVKSVHTSPIGEKPTMTILSFLQELSPRQ